MAITHKGLSAHVPAADAPVLFKSGYTRVVKISAEVTGGAGTVKLREGGATGNVIMSNVGKLTVNTQPILLNFEKQGGQPIRDLYVETLTNADLIVHLA